MTGRQTRSVIYAIVFAASMVMPWAAGVGIFFAAMDFLEN